MCKFIPAVGPARNNAAKPVLASSFKHGFNQERQNGRIVTTRTRKLKFRITRPHIQFHASGYSI